MNKKLFVGNLPYSLSDHELHDLFSPYGGVSSCNIAKDRESGRPRGFGFVEMESQEQAEAAITALNGRAVAGRQISVAISQPKGQATGTARHY